MSKEVITPIDKATKALIAANTSLEKSNAELTVANAALVKTLTETANQIEFKQSDLNQLTDAVKTKSRENEIELGLKVRENETKVVTEILKKQGLVAMEEGELAKLNAKIERTEESIQEQVAADIAAYRKDIDSQYASKFSTLESDHKILVAQLRATLEAANTKNELLSEQLEAYKDTIEEERKARIAIEESRAKANGVTINTTK